MSNEQNPRNEALSGIDAAITNLHKSIDCLREAKKILNEVGVMQMTGEIPAEHKAQVDLKIIELCKAAGHGPAEAILALYAAFFPPFYKAGDSIPQPASRPYIVSSATWAVDYHHNMLVEEYRIDGSTFEHLRIYPTK